MAQESIKGWGGRRERSGPNLAVPAGTGAKSRITIALGADLLEQLRQHHPELADLSEQDLVRAAVWLASGQAVPRNP